MDGSLPLVSLPVWMDANPQSGSRAKCVSAIALFADLSDISSTTHALSEAREVSPLPPNPSKGAEGGSPHALSLSCCGPDAFTHRRNARRRETPIVWTDGALLGAEDIRRASDTNGTKQTGKQTDGLSASIIRRVVDLAERSLRRRNPNIRGNEANGNGLDGFASAADELFEVTELGKMADECDEVINYLKPTTDTEVTT